MFIDGKNYFNKIDNIKDYNINVVKSSRDLDEMIKYFKKYINKTGKKFIGLDFEFNSSSEGKKIALFQINLEIKEEKNGQIYLFYPPDLTNNQMDILINLLIDSNIKKVVHGAESLDIPYLFKNILTTLELKKKFCDNLIDTRYLCEYYHLKNNIMNKCKIYYILLEMNVITQSIFEYLLKNEEDMGPIYLVNIDVRKLNEFTILYTTFDVLYLIRLVESFPDNDIYNNLVPKMTGLNFLERYEKNIIKPYNIYFSRMNNFFLYQKYQGKNLRLLDIFYNYYYWVEDSTNSVRYLVKINYFKKVIEIMIKYIIYKYVIKNYHVMSSYDRTESNFFVPDLKLFGMKRLKQFYYELKKAIIEDIEKY